MNNGGEKSWKPTERLNHLCFGFGALLLGIKLGSLVAVALAARLGIELRPSAHVNKVAIAGIALVVLAAALLRWRRQGSRLPAMIRYSVAMVIAFTGLSLLAAARTLESRAAGVFVVSGAVLVAGGLWFVRAWHRGEMP
ncbi:MAG TPA: hypothetical protein VFL90_16520 [Methylomirabilota bacterium]|nr:hypothetical protein [Methylomirabilota bacterium]